MKIVLDTNVIVSALMTQGLSCRVLDICIDYHDIYISEFIRNEVSTVLGRKFGVSARDIKKTMQFISSVFILVKPQGSLPDVCRDSDDNNILLLSEYITADLLITGDKDLLSLRNHAGTRIINPRDFMETRHDTQ